MINKDNFYKKIIKYNKKEAQIKRGQLILNVFRILYKALDVAD